MSYTPFIKATCTVIKCQPTLYCAIRSITCRLIAIKQVSSEGKTERKEW